MTSRSSARFSTHSGAPSLQPSLTPTYNSSIRTSQATTLSPPEDHPTPTEKQPYSSSPYNPAAASTSTLASSDPKSADLKSWSGALERMQDERLEKQRYTMSSVKSDEVSKLALGAKVERALARRMVGQDATFSAPRGGRSAAAATGEKRKEVEV